MKKYLILIFVALAAVFQSCDNNDDLWDAIDDLKSRVQALETQVDALNGNIEALQKLYGGATISKVETSDGKYLITLTNGETIELVQGSEAEAVIPIVSINDKGEWQVSIDNGATFTSLGVKAVAEDGTTPRFRIDEATGYWQVSYDGGTSFENVKDTKGQPVKAIGSGTVTDKFFEEVKVDGGDLYIRLLGGEELRIPIVSDFFCRIVTPTEGVQTFDAGATKRFVVEIRGVEQVKLSAPEGWSARLTDAVDERAELIVTAPAAVTRATADTSKDVAIEAFAAGGLSTVAKIQVESTGTAPAAPTVAVTNSATVEPTQSALTFDVAPSANADGWKYLCLKSTEAAPDAARVLAEGTAGAGTGVTVGNLEANTAYTIYVVAYAGDLTSEVASVGNMTAAAPVTAETDYYQDYQDGKDIALGDLTINKTVYPEAQLLKPSELTAAILQTGGLIFVDNSDESALAHTVNGTSVNAGQTSALVLIGRYKEREQAALTLPEMRCNRNVAVMNLHLIGNTDNTFTTTNAKNLNPDLLLVDCTLDVKRYFIYDNNGNWSFNNILINNSFVMYPVGATNQPALYSITTTAKAGGYPMQSIKLTNNVLYATAPTQAYILQCGNNAQYDTKNLRIEITGNTLYNIYQPNIMIRAYVLAGLTVTKNVGYYTGVTAKSYLTGVYDTAGFTADKAEVTYNYLYTAPVSDTNFWSAKHTGSYTPANNQMGDGVEAPFSSMDAAKGYFPVDASVVKTGAGATYDTKAWFKAE